MDAPIIYFFLAQKVLIVKKLEMSYSNNRTVELWRSFMPRRKEIHYQHWLRALFNADL